MSEETPLFRRLQRQWWLALIVMGLSFVLFGITSLNLIDALRANVGFLLRHGTDAIRDGGLIQLLELVIFGYLAAGFYVIFKVCEKALVKRISHYDEDVH